MVAEENFGGPLSRLLVWPQVRHPARIALQHILDTFLSLLLLAPKFELGNTYNNIWMLLVDEVIFEIGDETNILLIPYLVKAQKFRNLF